ncbi:23S rRNA (pseudouridine(1915)-N(3))-methyltransferase RlmH [Solemya pervernicosa gill symbiont]|uniref:Ribosomal RNA large subunit methyltransferase H n=2 Tax=Gammaproteobacteria incertae sedis TaxID=118884 RepID=A0A1T2L7I2_9GAMM|nr:23S rRNA (pseudouridine(1915)-N(3))-methyltransferase RlmH [Candidatus Reidiella endopervernicosa]OOZ40896.1 23S rRNA (pseudouridine(1915)-N(3))-methyltransferase RlmH [Solemya pervernicosa gill symbiont]QKQ26128.1 23S rRNA (pseudouridine(1915)-N(3))-methyltransferase RlmH [Candidatus Reidiella endopervernicosa]
MQIHLIAVGNKIPGWVVNGYEEYAKRLPRECSLKLVEINPGHRGKNANLEKAMVDEEHRIFDAIPKNARVVALEVKGKPWSTQQLSQRLESWLGGGQDIALLVGGPEGLSENCRKRADELWSLSPLTLPHPLVRVLLSEQLYRAWSILQGHPYHR